MCLSKFHCDKVCGHRNYKRSIFISIVADYFGVFSLVYVG